MSERRNGVFLLAGEAKCLATGDEDGEIGARGEQLGHARGRLDHLLEVVEEEQEPPGPDVLGKRRGCAQLSRRLLEDELRIVDGGERHPEDAVRIGVRAKAGRLESEPRLTRPTWASQREQPDVVPCEELRDLGELLFAAQERRRGHRQVGPIETLEGRKVAPTELVDALRRREIL